MFTTRILSTASQLAELVPEWDRVAALEGRDGFCRTAGWYLSWLRYIRPDAQPLVIEVRRDAELVGLAPFCRIHQNRYVRVLCIGGSHIACGDYLGLLAVPDYQEQVCERVFCRLAELSDEWDLLSLPDVAEDAPLLRYAERFAVARGWKPRAQERRTCPVIELPQTYEKYLATLSQNGRRSLRHKRKVLLDELGCEVLVHVRGAALHRALDTLIELHLARWQSVNDPGTLGQPGFREFLQRLSETGVCEEVFRLYELRHQEKSVALLLNFHFGESALQYQSGWDTVSPLAGYSPGSTLMGFAIENAICEGKRYYDFMRGDEAYKHSFARQSRQTATYLFARSVGARAYLANLDLRDHAKRSLRALRRAA
jgi:CelD/BcsL family acetyltransferase involved in cellulose biosynthesis